MSEVFDERSKRHIECLERLIAELRRENEWLKERMVKAIEPLKCEAEVDDE